MGRIFITLEKSHIEFADKIARRRRANASDNNWQPAYGAPVEDAAALAIDILGARTECAAYLHYSPVKWYAFEKGAKFPDLEEWIDVKGVDEHHHRLIIGAEKNPDWAYLLVDATDHPTYEIVCWCWGHEGKQELYWEVHREDGGGYFIRRDNPMMKSPQELMDIIRERQRASRAGLVGHDKKHGHFIHYCHCGRDASFGHDVHLSKGQFGVWYCMEHNPS